MTYRSYMADRNDSASPGGPQPAVSGSAGKRSWVHEDVTEWVDLAYKAGMETLKAQREETVTDTEQQVTEQVRKEEIEYDDGTARTEGDRNDRI